MAGVEGCESLEGSLNCCCQSSFPVGSMLMRCDLRPELRLVCEQELPILAEWGCFDRIVPATTAREFERCAHTKVLWVPGGHSWMLARPRGQVDVLKYLPPGQDFLAGVDRRWRRWAESHRRLRVAG